jgi:hypothetical protein
VTAAEANNSGRSIVHRVRASLWRYRREIALGTIAAVLGLVAGTYLQNGRAPAPQAPAPSRATLTLPPAPSPETRGQVIIGWTSADGGAYRAIVTAADYRGFLARDRAEADAASARLTEAARERVHEAVVPAFEGVAARVPAFGAWTFDWWTSWILLGQVIGWMWDEVSNGVILGMPARVQGRLIAEVEGQFDALVLQPEQTLPPLASAFARSLETNRAELAELCRRHAENVRTFVSTTAARIERASGPGTWTPVASADAASTFNLTCNGNGQREMAQVQAVLAGLRQTASISDPVDEVIVRLARPFATKLISYVILPAIIAGLIGAVALPLLGILPNILSGVIAGLLTGALGAAVIGFSASASVDWLLTRADELRNRAGFEVQVRRAVTQQRDGLEAAILDIHRQAIQSRLRPFAEQSGR